MFRSYPKRQVGAGTAVKQMQQWMQHHNGCKTGIQYQQLHNFDDENDDDGEDDDDDNDDGDDDADDNEDDGGDDDDDDDEYHHCSALIQNRVLESSAASEHRSAEPSHAFTFDLRGDD